jgi:hypothetical protein
MHVTIPVWMIIVLGILMGFGIKVGVELADLII